MGEGGLAAQGQLARGGPLGYVCRDSTSGLPVGCQRLAAPTWPVDPHPLSGKGVGCKADHWRQAAAEPTDVLLHWFWAPTADLKPHRVGLQPSITGWIVAADPICANPPYDY